VREMSVPIAAQRLGVSWHVALRLLLRGELEGRKDDTGRYWLVTEASVERARSRRAEGSDASSASSG